MNLIEFINEKTTGMLLIKILETLSEAEFDILYLYHHKTLCTSNCNTLSMKAKHDTQKYRLCIIPPLPLPNECNSSAPSFIAQGTSASFHHAQLFVRCSYKWCFLIIIRDNEKQADSKQQWVGIHLLRAGFRSDFPHM